VISGMGRVGQTAIAGMLMEASSRMLAMVSSVMSRLRCTAHSSFASSPSYS